MNVVLLMNEILSRQIELRVENGKLHYKAPEGALTPELRELITTHKAAILDQLSGITQTEPETLLTDPSPAQESLWFFNQVQGPNFIYNIPFVLRLQGLLDNSALRQSLNDMVTRHQSLRSSFVHDGQSLRLKITRDVEAPWSEQDICSDNSKLCRILLRDSASVIVRHCFDLSEAPLMTASLFRLGSEEHVLVMNFHHIVVDGWSVAIIIKELAAGYEARHLGRKPALPPLKWQYTDYIAWHGELLRKGAMDTDLAFWRKKLDGAPVCISMPPDFHRPAEQDFAGSSIPLRIDDVTTTKLRAQARTWGASLNQVTLAVTAILLEDFSGSTDIVIGLPLANRVRRELEPVIGMFVNVVPLRFNVSPDMRISELVGEVKRANTEALAHCNLPFPLLVKALEKEKDLSIHPVFQTAYDFLPPLENRFSFGGIEVETLDIFEQNTISKYDCTFYFEEQDGGLAGQIEFNSRLYRPETVKHWVEAYKAIVKTIVDNPNISLGELPIIGIAERETGNSSCSGLVVPLPDESPWSRFEAVAKKYQEEAAIDDMGVRINFRELERRAEIISAKLAELNITKGDRVGLFMPRSCDYIASMLGVIRRGAVFVPFDHSQPIDRLKLMFAQARLSAVVCHSRHNTAAMLVPSIIEIDDGLWKDGSAAPEVVHTMHEDPVYMIFTSGSSGIPKAVSIPWRGLCNVVQWCTRIFSLLPGERVSEIASLAFDASIFEIWQSLLVGCTIVFVPEEVRLDPRALRDWLIKEHIAVHFSPTPLAEELLRLEWPAFTSLRLMSTGGQTLHSYPPANLPFKVVNLYGPTEYTIVGTWCPLVPNDSDPGLPPIGLAIDNTRIAVLNENGRRTSPGNVGELYLSGAGIALEYFGNNEATASSFVSLSGESGVRWYRTGDQVRMLSGGVLEFVGRIDGQIKLRGYRIEIGEVESALLKASGVTHAAVRLEEDQLIAYIEKSNAYITPGRIREALSGLLPAYMIPSYIVILDRLPRQSSGKIDLGSIPFHKQDTTVTNTYGVRNGNQLESDIARAWAIVLNHPGPALNENFFDLGGHSMMLVRLKDQIRKEAGRDITIMDLFRYPTVSRQARFLGQGTLPLSAELQPQARLNPSSHGIAIIGMAGRFPKAESVEKFWQNLCDGFDCISTFSREELQAAGVPPELLESPDYVSANGILKDFDRFDADFFGISAREAEVMDPQQRLLLEEAWHVFEDAGLDPARIGVRVGVFIGSSLNTYLFENVLPHRNIVESLGSFAVMIGNDKDFAATRVSYKLGLLGPSMSVNTACSTSLVAIHQAVTAIRDGQCEMAIAGGACVRSRQIDGYRYEIGGILSRDGNCRAFDAEATGMVGGNGVALVLLKPLDKAISDKDHIYAVIKGSSVNNDGFDKIGFTAPSVRGQSLVIRDALDRAGVEPQTVLYVEAHGTGTQLGDSIEVAALAENYATGVERELPLLLGSVKTNVGHLDAAAGVAGMIKTALCLHEHSLVPSIHFKERNPQIEWPGDSIKVSTQTCPWNGNGTPLRAAVSSFGIGGTNAHVILEEPPVIERTEQIPDDDEHRLILFSGKTERALKANAEMLADWLKMHHDTSLADVAYTLAFGRRHWEYRSAVCVTSMSEAVEMLSESLISFDRADSVAFMFSGMGAQKPGMGSALYNRIPLFKSCIDQCAEILRPILGLDIRKFLLADPDDESAIELLNQHRIGQPVVFTLEYALAQFWMSIGLSPRVLIGHSLGEWVAACVAGVFTLPDALRLVSLRGGLMEAQRKGAMLAVTLSEAELVNILPDGLDIATVNALDQIVVAGSAEEIDNFVLHLEKKQVHCKILRGVKLAAHSSVMEPALGPLRAAIASVTRHAPNPEISIVSNITGCILEPAQLQSPDYWTEHLRQCVRFADGLNTLWGLKGLALLECGPAHTLCNIAHHDVRKPDNRAVIASFYGDIEPDMGWKRILESAGTLWSVGLSINLEKLFEPQGFGGKRIPMPGYAFQRQRYWLNAESMPEAASSITVETIENEPQQTPSNLSPTEERVISIMLNLLGPVNLGRHRDFFLCGGNSLMAVRLASNLRDAFGIPLTPRQIIKERTPAKIAALLEDGGAHAKATSESDSCLVLLSRGNDQMQPIVLVHAVGGGIFIYRELLQALDTEHPVYGLQAPGLWDDSSPIKGLRRQAELYYSSLLKAGINHPVMLAGSSYGGLVCYELNQLYHKAGHRSALVALFDSPGPGHMPARMESEAEICAWMLSRDIPSRNYASDLAMMQGVNHEGRVSFLLDQIRLKIMPYATENDVKSLLRVFSQNLANMWNWIPEPHQAKILFFKAAEHVELLAENPEQAWVPLATDGIDILLSPGDHSSMLSFPHVSFIAEEIKQRLSFIGDNGALNEN